MKSLIIAQPNDGRFTKPPVFSYYEMVEHLAQASEKITEDVIRKKVAEADNELYERGE